MWRQLVMLLQGRPELLCRWPAPNDERYHTAWKAADADAVWCRSVAGEHLGPHAGGRDLERACKVAMQRVKQYLIVDACLEWQ